MTRMLVSVVLLVLALPQLGRAQSKADEEAVRALPTAFNAAFNKHDGRALAQIMAEDVDFVNVGLTWLHGRAVFETYHTRLLEGRFRDVVTTGLETHVRFIRPDVAVVRHSWSIEGDRNQDGSARPERYGLMTLVAEKQEGTWLVSVVQNVNGPAGAAAVAPPEAHGIPAGPIVVPRVP